MTCARNVLVVDDEAMIREAVASYLEKQGCQVFTAESGSEALRIFEAAPISFVILDLMLPDMAGEDVCAALRRRSRVPILMLTAKSAEEDILEGLHLGADDYMTKPFSLKQLYARMEAILRRAAGDLKPLAEVLSWNQGDLTLDYARREVRKKGAPVALTPIEWKVLSALVKYPRRVFSREDLIAAAFGADFDGYDRVIDTHIKNLRKKLEDDPKNPVYLHTVHGLGYRFGGEAI